MACPYCSNGCYRCNPLSAHGRASTALKNFNLSNPIPDEVTDSDDLKKLFSKRKYIPYAGYTHDSQHTYLRFIDNLAALSPTLGGVINSINYMCFGGKTGIKKMIDDDFELTGPDGKEALSTDITLEHKLKFLETLKTFDLNGKDWSSIKTVLYKSFKTNGNAYLQVEIMQSLGVSKVKYSFIPTRNVLYVVPDLYSERRVAISKSWDLQYIKKYPPEEIPVYPAYEKYSDGSIKTIIHVKEGDNDFYGRPDWWACSQDAFLEIKNKEYLLKAAHNNFTGKVLIEFEGEAGNDTITNDEEAKKEGFKSAEQRWAYNFTNQGDDPQSLLISERPYGAKEAYTKEFSINTNENYYDKLDKISTDKIILVNGWSKKLLGIEESAGLGGNTFIDTIKTKLSIIEYYQDSIDNNILNKANSFVFEMLSMKEFIGIGLESNNPFDHLLKMSSEQNIINQNPSTNVNNTNA